MKKLVVSLLSVSLLVVSLLTACGQVEETGKPAGATVDTMFGEVTVPANPERVVALGWSDAETALALGVQPVAATDWMSLGGEASARGRPAGTTSRRSS